ncbi:MAG: tRNA (guanosine(46)-N7)-methyltransferase TrmB [Bacteroidales bacterium]|nr:tRNA (guanosine(46)-N7)-methyltransferase TrmB [Bacteroidales bacterium]
MGKDKIRRFKENDTFECLYQPQFQEVFGATYYMKGQWHERHFKNGNPLVLELGCGRGEYTVSLAKKIPQKNFIGVDIKGARMWRGAKTVTEESIENAAFVRSRIEFIESVFAPEEVSEIWITFPDPQMKKQKKRLTATPFLERYKSFLKDNGIIHLKTDSAFLHNYTLELVKQNNLELIEANSDIYGTGRACELLSIKTRYEMEFLEKGIKITYLSFRLKKEALLNEPEWDSSAYER